MERTAGHLRPEQTTGAQETKEKKKARRGERKYLGPPKEVKGGEKECSGLRQEKMPTLRRNGEVPGCWDRGGRGGLQEYKKTRK